MAPRENPTGRRRTQAERREATRALLLDAARDLFVEQGFAQSATPELVERAKVTRGALYHHFEDKTDLFRAVAEREAEEVTAAIGDATRGITDPDEAMTTGSEAYFDAMSVPGRAHLLLAEAPSVLGPEAARALSAANGSDELKAGLKTALPDLGEEELMALGDLLSSTFDRAALEISRGGNRALYSSAARRIVESLTGQQ